MNKRFEKDHKFICESGEVAFGYENYLKTNHWRNIRKIVVKNNNNTCERCGKVIEKGGHVHHKTYARVGKEKLTDLSFYCEECHSIIHDEKRKSGKSKTKGKPKTWREFYMVTITSKMKQIKNEHEMVEILNHIDRILNKHGVS